MANIYTGMGKMQSPWAQQRGANQAFRGAMQQNPNAVASWFQNQGAQGQSNALLNSGGMQTPWGTMSGSGSSAALNNALSAGGIDRNQLNQQINANSYNNSAYGGGQQAQGLDQFSPSGPNMTSSFGNSTGPMAYRPRSPDADTIGNYNPNMGLNPQGVDTGNGSFMSGGNGNYLGNGALSGLNQGTPGSWNPNWTPQAGANGDMQGTYTSYGNGNYSTTPGTGAYSPVNNQMVTQPATTAMPTYQTNPNNFRKVR